VTREPPFCHSFGVWPKDYYMLLQRSTVHYMSCFAIGFPLLGTIEYHQAPFTVAKVSPYWVQQNTLMPLLHLAASHTSPAHPTRKLTRAFLVSQQAIPYWTRGCTYYSGVSTPKIRSLADSSNHMP
jgi:hypothetical protein